MLRMRLSRTYNNLLLHNLPTLKIFFTMKHYNTLTPYSKK